MKVCPTCKTVYAGGEVFCPVDATRLTTPSQMTGAPDPQDPLVGSLINARYRIVRRIGEGGMGIVYEAQHVVIEKRVALKVLRNDFSSRPDVVERFRQEAKSASRIGHENIVDISDFGETPSGQGYFVMEYLEGADLADVLAQEHTLSPQRATDIVVQCCRALGAAHSKGIVHRDMKPENIFVTRRDTRDFIKIVDFGIAKMSDVETPGSPGRKLTKTGMIFGTPEYMSPEQSAGKPLDHRVDIYACGVILYELLSGRVPFVGDTFMGILTQHMFEEVPSLRSINPNVNVNPALEAVVHRALAKDPDRRFQTMDEMAREVTRAMNASSEISQTEGTFSGYGEPVVTRQQRARLMSPTTIDEAEFPREKQKTTKWPIVAAVALGVLVLGAGAYAMLRPGESTDELQPVGSVPVSGTLGNERATQDAGNALVGDNAHVNTPNRTAEVDASNRTTTTMDGTMVQLTIETRPSGASIMVEGRGPVCSRTPCSFETERGEVLKIQARRGRAVATRELTPTQAMTIEMLLDAPRRPAGGREGQGGAGEKGEKAHSGDLKIPDIFQNH